MTLNTLPTPGPAFPPATPAHLAAAPVGAVLCVNCSNVLVNGKHAFTTHTDRCR